MRAPTQVMLQNSPAWVPGPKTPAVEARKKPNTASSAVSDKDIRAGRGQ